MNTGRGLTGLRALQSTGEGLSCGLRLPLPGPAVGRVRRLGALDRPPVRGSVAAVAECLPGHLSLRFVPVGVGAMRRLDLLGHHGLRLVGIIVRSTWVGLIVTALGLRARLRRTRGGSSAPCGTGDRR